MSRCSKAGSRPWIPVQLKLLRRNSATWPLEDCLHCLLEASLEAEGSLRRKRSKSSLCPLVLPSPPVRCIAQQQMSADDHRTQSSTDSGGGNSLTALEDVPSGPARCKLSMHAGPGFCIISVPGWCPRHHIMDAPEDAGIQGYTHLEHDL